MTGRGTRKWRYFDRMDAIVGHKPASQPEVVLDTLDDAGIVIGEAEVEVEEIESTGMEYYEGDDEEDGEGSFRIEEKENKTKESVKKT